MSSYNNFTFCPKCGEKNIHFNMKYWKCDNCQFVLYHNAASAANLLIYNNDNSILLEIRAKDPKRGMLDCPGGFTDNDETIEETAIRECKEELGIEPKNLEYLCSFPNDYYYKGFYYRYVIYILLLNYQM